MTVCARERKVSFVRIIRRLEKPEGSRFRCPFRGVLKYVERTVTLWWIPS